MLLLLILTFRVDNISFTLLMRFSRWYGFLLFRRNAGHYLIIFLLVSMSVFLCYSEKVAQSDGLENIFWVGSILFREHNAPLLRVGLI